MAAEPFLNDTGERNSKPFPSFTLRPLLCFDGGGTQTDALSADA